MGDDVAEQAARRTEVGVSEGVGDAADDPGAAGPGGLVRVAQPGDEEGRDEGGVVLTEVCVGALREVELVRLRVLLHLLFCRVGNRVRYPARLPRNRGQGLVDRVYEDAGGRDS